MKKHQMPIKLGLLAAGIAASALVSAANGSPASNDTHRMSSAAGNISSPVLTTPAIKGQRTPVISLTQTMGDVGFEIFDG